MPSIRLIIGLYLVRFIMAIAAGYIAYIWGFSGDNIIYIALGYFLLLMLLRLEVNDQLGLIYYIYAATLIAVPLSYVLVSLWGELLSTNHAIG